MMIREQVQTAMDKKGWSRARLAREAGVNQELVYRFLRGGGITTPTLESLMAVLGLEIRAAKVKS